MPAVDDHDRRAELIRQATDYIDRARRCAADGSAIGTREWLDAATAALAAAREVRLAQLAEQRTAEDVEKAIALAEAGRELAGDEVTDRAIKFLRGGL